MGEQELESYGINYAGGLKNCMGNPAFYKKIMGMFLADQCFPRAEAAMATGDLQELFGCLHELKGISGNAGLMVLFQATIPLVELLRNGTEDVPQVQSLYVQVKTAYLRACEGIRAYLAA